MLDRYSLFLLFVPALFFPIEVFASQRLSYEVIAREDQDPTLFTQGFEFHDGHYYYSSGLYNKSYLKRLSASTNKSSTLSVPPNIFAEGLTVFADSLYLVSWKAQTAWRFNRDTFQLLNTYRYAGEGWGLANNGKELIMSDGTNRLRFFDPSNFQEVSSITVTNNNQAINNLNELEFVNGLVWANQWRSNFIYAIDPKTGQVQATLDVSELQKEAAVSHVDSVTNGIAYDKERGLYWVTGKYWQYRYLIKISAINTNATDN